MKKIAFVLLAGLPFITAHAQFEFGAKAGMNLSTQNGSDAGDSRTLVNFNLGAFATMPIAHRVSIQPELVYSGQGTRYELSGGTQTEHANYLNIPVLLKFSHYSGFYLETGPQFGLLLGANTKYRGTSVDSKDSYNSADFAWVVGLGYKIPESPVGIDFRYNAGIANVEDGNHTGFYGSWRNDVVQLGVTYVLFSSSTPGNTGGKSGGKRRY